MAKLLPKNSRIYWESNTIHAGWGRTCPQTTNITGGYQYAEHRKDSGRQHADHGAGGRLDTTTAPQLENELKAELDRTDKLVLDFEKLEYISSAGLRVLLSAQKVMGKKGGMTIRRVNDVIMEIFEVTGFIDILNIET